MAIQFVTYDDSYLEAGKFYEVRVNKDNANAVVEVTDEPRRKVDFHNSRYIEVDYYSSVPPQIQVFEIIHNDNGVLKYDMVFADISGREDSTRKFISIQLSKAITGFITIN